MKDLSISQSYLICALNENGKLPALSTESPICLLAGGLMDLIFSKSIAAGTDKLLCITGELSEENQYLNSLYTFIKESKPMKVDNVIQNIRAELLENGAMSDYIIALVSLMDKSNQIKKLFSKYEKDQLKVRLKEINDSPSNKIVKKMILKDHRLKAAGISESFFVLWI